MSATAIKAAANDAGPQPARTLAQALVAAQLRAEAVEKDAQNTFHKYKYASAEAIIAEARAALSAEGLAVLPLTVDRDADARDHVWSGEGNDAWIAQPRRIRVTYRLLHESGEFMDFTSTTPVIPEKGRPEDKAEFGARTENLGYALRDLLLLPRVNEQVPAPSSRDDRNAPAPRPPAPRPAPYAPPKATHGTENAPKREPIKGGGFTDPEEEDSRLTSEYTEPVPVFEPNTGEQIRMEPGITSEQNKKIHALLRDVRNQYAEADYRKHLKKAFCKEHTNELSIREASNVIDGLMKRFEKIRPEMEAQAKDSEAALLARSLVELGEVFDAIAWTPQQRAAWCKERFGTGAEALSVVQLRTAISLLLCWGTPADYAAELKKAQAAGRCK